MGVTMTATDLEITAKRMQCALPSTAETTKALKSISRLLNETTTTIKDYVENMRRIQKEVEKQCTTVIIDELASCVAYSMHDLVVEFTSKQKMHKKVRKEPPYYQRYNKHNSLIRR